MKSIGYIIEEFERGKIIRDADFSKRITSNPVKALKQILVEYQQLPNMKGIKGIEYSECLLLRIASKSNPTETEKKYLNEYMEFIKGQIKSFKNTGDLSVFILRIFKDHKVSKIASLAPIVEDCKEAFNMLSNQARKIFDNYVKNGHVTDRELSILAFYLELTIDNPKMKPYQEKVFEMMCKSGRKTTFRGLSFCLNYAVREEYKSKNDCPDVYVVNLQDQNNANGFCYTGTGNIFINSRYANEPLIELNLDKKEKFTRDEREIHETHGSLSVVYHELQHETQYQQSISNYHNKTAFFSAVTDILCAGYSNSSYNEYHSNYMYKATENDANYVGSHTAARISEKYHLNSENTFRRRGFYYKTKFAKSIHGDEQGNRYDGYTYNIEFLEQILIKHPELLKKYDVLNYIYDSTGHIKTFKEFVKLYTRESLKKDNSETIDLINYVFNYYILNADKLGINFNLNMFDNDVDKVSMLMLLSDHISSESRNLKDMLDYLNTNEVKTQARKKARIELIAKKAKALIRALQLFENLRKNGELDRLITFSNDYNNPYHRHTTFSFDTTGDHVRTVIDHILGNSEIRDIDELRQIASDLEKEGTRIYRQGK